jgi:hypothetical protein
MWTIVLLILSNIFMTFAWYGHLRFFPGQSHSLGLIVLVSWGIALIEYCLAVPANRIGQSTYGFETAQLKVIQEIITLVVFAVFSVVVLKEHLRWNHAAGFVCMVAAAAFVFNPFVKPTTPIIKADASTQPVSH